MMMGRILTVCDEIGLALRVVDLLVRVVSACTSGVAHHRDGAVVVEREHALAGLAGGAHLQNSLSRVINKGDRAGRFQRNGHGDLGQLPCECKRWTEAGSGARR